MNNYITQLSSLKTAKIAGMVAPHKPVLLLSIIDLIEKEVIRDNHVELSEDLVRLFAHNWARYVGRSLVFQAKIATPFWHMQNEGFWRLVGFDDEEITKENMRGSMYSVANLRKMVRYAEIDRELFEIFMDEDARAKFRTLLISTYLGGRSLQVESVTRILMGLGSTIFMAS